jgi:hypothetical protein
MHRTIQVPNPRWSRVNLFLHRRFPYREIGGCGAERFMPHKTPNPETPNARHLSASHGEAQRLDTCFPLSLVVPPCHVLFGISRIADPRCKFPCGRKPRNSERRYAGSDATCPVRYRSLTVPIKSGNRYSRFQRIWDSCLFKRRRPISR